MDLALISVLADTAAAIGVVVFCPIAVREVSERVDIA